MVCMTYILFHSHAPNIVLSLPDDRDIHCSDCGWRNVLFCHLTIEFFFFRVSTQALIPLSSDPSDNVADKAVHKELGDSLVRAATTASSLEAEQDSGNITKTRSKATPNESSSQRTNSGGGPRGNTLQSDEDRLKLDEVMALCTTLQNRVLDLEKTKTTQHNEIASLKRRVKKLEKKSRSRTYKLKRLYKVGLTARVESSDDEESLGEDASKQGRINDIDADEEITLVSVQNVDEEMFDVNVLDGEEGFVAEQEVDANEKDDDGEITLAQALIEMKSTKPKVKGVIIQESDESTTTKSTSTISLQQSQDKGKGILIEPVEPIKKKDLIRLDEEVALKLQAEFDEEKRLAREKAEKVEEANISLIETWDDIQAKIDVDHQLAKRLQAQEQEELSIEEKATLFQQLLEKRRKHFAAKRAKEKKKPRIKAQQRIFHKCFSFIINNHLCLVLGNYLFLFAFCFSSHSVFLNWHFQFLPPFTKPIHLFPL
ncbi:hypothetical protein Tco_0240566 [Tanacetum coccineum]